MQVYAGVPDRTNAYLVYGYSNKTVRMWVDSSNLGGKYTYINDNMIFLSALLQFKVICSFFQKACGISH